MNGEASPGSRRALSSLAMLAMVPPTLYFFVVLHFAAAVQAGLLC
mgnify:CR=1 FL=1